MKESSKDFDELFEEARRFAASKAGPVVLEEGYLRAIETIENLPSNRSGSDKSWVFEALEQARQHLARARRL
jgi:hypothetical protein